MLSSIHPLGERGRHNRWWLTVTAFTIGAAGAGTAVASLAGWAGSLLLEKAAPAVAVAAVLVAAGAADLFGITVPGPHRQVDERWIGQYRGWVYGLGFGAQLGTGLATYVVTFGTYAMVAASFLTASPSIAAVFGLVFGVGRSVPLLAAASIDRPSRLGRFHETMARLGTGIHRWAAAGSVAIGMIVGLTA